MELFDLIEPVTSLATLITPSLVHALHLIGTILDFFLLHTLSISSFKSLPVGKERIAFTKSAFAALLI